MNMSEKTIMETVDVFSMEDMVQAILHKIEETRNRIICPYLVAIDGRCASGKTTLAKKIQEKTGWSVLCMDHYFLRPEQRTKERLHTPGGNVDRERFLEEVLLPIQKGAKELTCQAYDCHEQVLLPSFTVKITPVMLIEGSYSCHPALRPFYDLCVFLSTGREEQLRRILERNGEEAVHIFKERWIPMEENYFVHEEIEKHCTLHLYT